MSGKRQRRKNADRPLPTTCVRAGCHNLLKPYALGRPAVYCSPPCARAYDPSRARAYYAKRAATPIATVDAVIAAHFDEARDLGLERWIDRNLAQIRARRQFTTHPWEQKAGAAPYGDAPDLDDCWIKSDATRIRDVERQRAKRRERDARRVAA
jgi:hypothetical protein